MSAEQTASISFLGRDVERYTYTATITGGNWSIETLNTHRDLIIGHLLRPLKKDFTVPVVAFRQRRTRRAGIFRVAQSRIKSMSAMERALRDETSFNMTLPQLPETGMAEVQQMDERPYNLAAKVTGPLPYGESELLRN